MIKCHFITACGLRALGLLLVDGAPTVKGKDFLARQPFFFYEIGRRRKVEKSTLGLEMDCLSEGYKRVVDKIWGPMAKTDFC